MLDRARMAAMIDHTILKAAATSQEIIQLCKEARQHHFASVCINPCYVKLASEQLAGTDVKVCTVVGFPLGANATEIKAQEARHAVLDGAREVDMVINVGALKEGRLDYVEKDIAEVVKNSAGAVVKVIIETCYLTDDEKKEACRLSEKAGAHFVKTSTGFGTGGATIDDVRLMKSIVGDRLQVKASGGIKTLNDALNMVEAGASRIGTSSGIKIIGEML